MTLNQIHNGFLTYFKVWWIPIVSYLIPFLLFALAMFVKIDFMVYVFITVFYLNIWGNVLSAVYQISIGKWYWIIPQILISGYLFLHISLFFTFVSPDFYGAHKTIPDNIDIYEPFNTPPPHKPPLDITPTKADMAPYHLALNEGSQAGIYRYYTDYQPTELGSFYIKAYEVTSNDRLSADDIKNRSKIVVDSLEPQIYSEEFWIYEGSQGDKYGARIELWFAPSDGGEDYKLTERNYIVEGWQF